MIRRLGALLIATPVATGVILTGGPGSASAIWGQVTAPADGALITSGAQVTAQARYSGISMQLRVTVPGGGDQFLTSGGGSGTLSAPISIGVNGKYTVRLMGSLTKHVYDSNTFTVRIPPAAPSGVSAQASGNTLTVSWNLGLEDDLTGYKVSAGQYGSASGSTATFCSGTTCTKKFTIPAGSTGSATVSVRAVRSNGTGGTITSSPTSRTVQLAGPAASGGGATGGGNTGGGNTGGGAISVGNLPPVPGSGTESGGTPLTPFNEQSPVTLPNVQPEGATPGFAYPEPVVAGQNAGGPDPNALARLQWGKSIALALILLVIAAHLGTWTRRMRVAQAGVSSHGMAARIARSGSGRDRVKKAQEHIARAEAMAKAATGSRSTRNSAKKSPESRPEASARRPGARTGRHAKTGTAAAPARPARPAASVPGPRPATAPANGPNTGTGAEAAPQAPERDVPVSRGAGYRFVPPGRRSS